jgi:peptidoglycan/xylan/chitin deacetylase (PgdA/CDA1 family)
MLPRVPGLSHIMSRFRRRFERRVLILLYHRVTELRSDPWSLAVTPSHFSEHLDVLRKYVRTVSLQQLLRGLRDGKLPQHSVVVTFDDGYADNLYQAKPLLERHAIPATCFLTSGAVGNEREFWWDELDNVLLQSRRLPRELRLTISGRAYTWELDEDAQYSNESSQRHRRWKAQEAPLSPQHALYYTLWQLLHSASPETRQEVLGALLRWGGIESVSRPTHRTLLPEEVHALADGDLIEIGAHSVTHSALSALPGPAQQEEIRQSKAHLEEILGRPVTCFAYPYGRRRDYTPETTTLVQAAGFACACSNFSGAVHRSTDRFQLPRLYVHDWDGEQFTQVLSEWLRL